MQPNYDELFSLSGGHRRGALHFDVAHPDGFTDIELTHGLHQHDVAAELHHVQGKQARDFLGAGVAELISPKVQAILTELGATGWTSTPVTAPAAQAPMLEGYRLLVALGRAGEIDESRAERGWSDDSDGTVSMPVFRGLYFAGDEWDGSDVFMAPVKGHVFVTRRVRDALVQARVTNVDFEPLSQFESPDYDRA